MLNLSVARVQPPGPLHRVGASMRSCERLAVVLLLDPVVEAVDVDVDAPANAYNGACPFQAVAAGHEDPPAQLALTEGRIRRERCDRLQISFDHLAPEGMFQTIKVCSR